MDARTMESMSGRSRMPNFMVETPVVDYNQIRRK